MEIVRTEKEIAEIYDKCVESENQNESRYAGMTYEQGIKDCLDWLEGGDNPFEEQKESLGE